MPDDRYWKTDHPGWELDSETGAIINRDNNAYEKWKMRVQEDRNKKQLEKDVMLLKKDMHDIKSLLTDIFRKLDG